MNSSDIEIFRSNLDDLKFYFDTRISDVNKQLEKNENRDTNNQ